MDFDDIEAYLANLEQGYLSEVGNPSLACGVMIFEFCANPSDWQLKCWRFREWFGLGSFVFSTLEREPSPSRGIQGGTASPLLLSSWRSRSGSVPEICVSK